MSLAQSLFSRQLRKKFPFRDVIRNFFLVFFFFRLGFEGIGRETLRLSHRPPGLVSCTLHAKVRRLRRKEYSDFSRAPEAEKGYTIDNRHTGTGKYKGEKHGFDFHSSEAGPEHTYTPTGRAIWNFFDLFFGNYYANTHKSSVERRAGSGIASARIIKSISRAKYAPRSTLSPSGPGP